MLTDYDAHRDDALGWCIGMMHFGIQHASANRRAIRCKLHVWHQQSNAVIERSRSFEAGWKFQRRLKRLIPLSKDALEKEDWKRDPFEKRDPSEREIHLKRAARLQRNSVQIWADSLERIFLGILSRKTHLEIKLKASIHRGTIGLSNWNTLVTSERLLGAWATQIFNDH